jgi:hypothetical protein
MDPTAMKIQIVGWESELLLLKKLLKVCLADGITLELVIEDLKMRIIAKEALISVGQRHIGAEP